MTSTSVSPLAESSSSGRVVSRVPVYDICHPLVMESPGFAGYGGTGSGSGHGRDEGLGGRGSDGGQEGSLTGTSLARTNI